MATFVWTAAAASSWNVGASWSVAGVAQAAPPTAADDVLFGSGTGATNSNCTMTAASVCRSIAMTGYTGTVSGSGDLSIGDASGGAATLAGTLSGTWTTTFKSTSTNSGNYWLVTSNGKAFPAAVTFSGSGGGWKLADAASSGTSNFFALQGTFVGNGQTITCGSFASNGSLTRTVDITNCNINVSGTGTPLSFTATGMTFTSTGSTITCTGNGGTYNMATLSYGSLVWNGSTTTGFGPNGQFTCVNATFTGGATKTANYIITNSFTVTGTLTVGGNTVQGVNRVLLNSNTVGTQRTITATGATVVITGDVDFQDITITGSPTWYNDGTHGSASSAFVGDALGNGGAVTTNRTTPATQTATGTASFTWSTHGWTSRVPLPQDNVSIPNAFVAGRTVTADMPRLGADISFTCTGGVTIAAGVAGTLFGSFTMSAGISSWGIQVTFSGRSSHTMTTGGVTTNAWVVNAPGGTYTLQDALTMSGRFTNTLGTFVSNSLSMSITNGGACIALNGGSWTLGTSTVTMVGGGANPLSNGGMTAGNFSAASSSWVLAGASTTTRLLQFPAACTISTLTYTVANSPGALQISGAMTFAGSPSLNIGSGRTVTWPASTTNTLSNAPTMSGVAAGFTRLPGVSGNYISAPDSAALSITGDITILCRASLDDWTPASTGISLVGKYTTGQRSYILVVNNPTGNLQLVLSSDGTAVSTANSSAVPTIADGATLWCLVSWRASDGRTQFFTASGSIASPVASDFTQLGTDQTLAIASIFNSTAVLELGSTASGTANLATGNFYRAMIYNGVFSTAAFGGTLQFDTGSGLTQGLSGTWTDAAKTQFTESSANAATVTINGALAQVGDGRIVVNSSSGGTAATIAGPWTIGPLCSVKDITGSPSMACYALDSVNVSGNTGIVFSPPDEIVDAIDGVHRGRFPSSTAALVRAGRW